LQLEDGSRRQAIRKVAGARLQQIRAKLADLKKMEKVLSHLIEECESTGHVHPCPIIATLAGKRLAAAGDLRRPRRVNGRAARAAA
jgi:MerR family mercuric resistance operon transcriptional regulator